jgi:hypothetical protein
MTIASADEVVGAAWFKSSHSNPHGGNCVEAARLRVNWTKSSYSNAHGGNCVEAGRLAADWFKSSYSNNQGGACVEGARLAGGVMAIRDSKDPHGPALIFRADAWAAFVGAVSAGELGE